MNPNDPNLSRLEKIIGALGELADEVVVVGGVAAGLLITDPAQTLVRSTLDVDAVIETTSLQDFQAFEQRLRELGFRHDLRADAPMCRWLFDDVQFDLMPSDAGVNNDSNPWYPEAVATAKAITLPSGARCRLIGAPAFLGTKLSAFADRGNHDFYASQDIEDVFAVIDGREELADEIISASAELREYIRS